MYLFQHLLLIYAFECTAPSRSKAKKFFLQGSPWMSCADLLQCFLWPSEKKRDLVVGEKTLRFTGLWSPKWSDLGSKKG